MVTDRLVFRPFQKADAAEIYRLNSSLEVMRYLPKDEVYTSLVEARHFLEKYIQRTSLIPFAREAVIRKSDGVWLGWCGLKELKDGEVDLGFRFHREFWRQGYAYESGSAWVDYGFRVARLKRIIGNAAVGNTGSQRTLEKLGFIRCPEEDFSEGGMNWLRYEIYR